ncbi:MAG TPA: fibronectin type III domain-containing protein, partial [Acidimicrobiales bacterium]|nr:fibronectin type III domain-containing protein [Acidimicrobiales bacterium]
MHQHPGGLRTPRRRRLRAVAVVLAAVAVLVGGGIAAAAGDSTPPTLVSFNRTSPASVTAGQSVTVSYTATDDSSGVSSVVFHFTDVLGNDHTLTGSGGGPTTASAAVDGSWPLGNYRLDEIDVTDGNANKAAYVAGATSFNLDSANFTVTGAAAPPVKPTIRGAIDRTQLPTSDWQSVVNGVVLRANWADLQPSQGGDIVANNAIDQAIAQLRTMNAQNRGTVPPMQLKLRVLAGNSAPDWAKNLDGPGTAVSVQDAANAAQYDTVGRFWEPNFGAAYQDFMTKLAAKYDGVPEVRDVVISRCTLTTAEPFLRTTSDQTTINNLLAANFNVTDDHTCQQQQVDVHNAVWKQTTSSVAFTPYQKINSDGSKGIDEGWTETMIDYCRTALGSRCVLESNSIKDPSTPRNDNYVSMYAKIQSKGPPIAYQTASPNNGLGSLCATLGWAVSQGTGAVELPQAYVRDGVSNPAGMASYDKALEGAQPPDTDTPTSPSNLAGTTAGANSINITWSPSSDSGYGVACYTVSRGGTVLGTTMNTNFTDTSANPGVPTTYSVTANDGVNHTSAPTSAVLPSTTTSTSPTSSSTSSTSSSSTSTSTTLPPTTTTTIRANPPSAPQGFSTSNQCAGVVMNWSPPANNGGAPITSYRVYRGKYGAETFLASTPSPPFTDSTSGQYVFNYYRVTAVNAGGLE